MGTITLKPIPASAASTEDYGHYVGEAVGEGRLPIPFYGHVEEGVNMPFECNGKALIRTARIHPTRTPIVWFERHLKLTQFFIGLGTASFALVLGLPNHDSGAILPDLSSVRCFLFSPGTGIFMRKGTWHDFPMAVDRPVTCLTGNSAEVIDALVTVKVPQEIDMGDVYKIDLKSKMNTEIQVNLL